MKLKLFEYFKYLDANNNSRCVNAGEEILDAGHLILLGATSKSEKHVDLYALCLQTNALIADPHTLKGSLKVIGGILKIIKMHCTCKAGNSGRCKHISAALIYCTRTSITILELLSQTDIKCAWTAKKHTTKEQYETESLLKMPCLQNKVKVPPVNDVDDILFNKLVSDYLPNSSISLHQIGRRDTSTVKENVVNDGLCSTDYDNISILNNACQSTCMMELASTDIYLPHGCCSALFNDLFETDPSFICSTSIQGMVEWQTQRQYRITGSRCYNVYTYSKDDWENKSLSYFWPKQIYHKNLIYGTKTEAQAKQVLSLNFDIKNTGLIVSPSNLWLGYSPDGVIFVNGEPAALLEIKCPIQGATTNIGQVLDSKSVQRYLNKVDGQWQLKQRHKYYGQVQLGMALLNLSYCNFIVFASFDKSMCNIKVPFDYHFTKKMLEKVKSNYYTKMFHFICKYKK